MVVPSSNGHPRVLGNRRLEISLRPRMKIAQSPHSALRASWGDWLIFTLGLQEISSLRFPRPEDVHYYRVQPQSQIGVLTLFQLHCTNLR